ncbi:MAG TPA: hypothetical protein VL088_05440, partial [Pedobacter sp.]|nr:hypothetical protein [Pedobacter sp.]
MKRLLFLTCLISTCLFSYGQIFSIGSQMGVSPMIKIHITINQDTVSSIKNIIVNIAASNETDTTQKILFDKPIHSLVGPWAIYATVFDTKNANGITMRDATSMLGS